MFQDTGARSAACVRWEARLMVPLAILLLAALFYDHNASYSAYYLFALAGLVYMARGAATGLSMEERTILGATLAVVVTAWLSYAYNGFSPKGYDRFLEAHTPLLALIPIFFLARQRDLTTAIWLAAAAGAIACGVLALLDIVARFPKLGTLDAVARALKVGYRASAGDNPLPLAYTSLVLSSVVAAGWSWFNRLGWMGWIAWVIALAMGGFALVLSGSRGAWIAVPFLVVAFLVLRWCRLGGKARALLVGALVLMPFAALQTDVVHRRFELAVKEISKYENRVSEKDVNTSVGLRFDTYRAAWAAFQERPLLGYGPGGWVDAFEDAKETNVAQGGLLRTPHNMYLSSLSLRGLVGFTADMAFLGAFAYVFGRRARSSEGAVGYLALAGMFVIIATLVMGLTWVPLGWWRKQTVLVCFLLATIWGVIRYVERQASPPEPTAEGKR